MKKPIGLRSIIGILLILALFSAYAIAMGNIASASAKGRFLKTQQMLARAQAGNIQTFFEDFGTSLRILAQSPSIERRDSTTVKKMDTWVSEWGDTGLTGGVVLTDARGIVRFNSNVLGTRDVGASLADRDYFVWASKQEIDGEYIVGSPIVSRLGASKGERIVVVASPVFINKVFAGVIAASVKLSTLTKRYVAFLKLSDTIKVRVLNESGEFLDGRSNTDEGILAAGQAQNIISTATEGSTETGGYVLSYSPISLAGQKWWVVMISPAEEMKNLIKDIYMRQMTILPIALVSLLVVWLLAQKRL